VSEVIMNIRVFLYFIIFILYISVAIDVKSESRVDSDGQISNQISHSDLKSFQKTI